MNIACLAFSFIPHMGGAEVFTYNLLDRLARRGHRVHLFIPRFAFKQFRSLGAAAAFTAHPVFFQEVRLLQHAPLLLKLSLEIRQRMFCYDIWQVIGAYPAGYLAQGLSGHAPIVLRSYGKDIQKDALLGYGDRLDQRIEVKIRDVLQDMSRCVALTPTVKECFRELGVPEHKIFQISNGIDSQRFSLPADRMGIRQRLGIRNDQTLILSVGRYHSKKGYELIPETARVLIDRGHKIRWLIVGKGLHKLQGPIEQAGMKEVVLLKDEIASDAFPLGQQLHFPSDELIALYKAADVFVLPSLLETFGMVLIEAMAAGTPVVTTDAPGCRDVVRNEVNGLLSKPSDSASLAYNIEKILLGQELREQLTQNARGTAETYDWKQVADRYEELYLSLIQKREFNEDHN